MRKITLLTYLVLWVATALVRIASAGTITYYHDDLLGSPIAATNAGGQVTWREGYRPYGERLTNAPASAGNDVWFTSRRQDVDTGLVYMGARYYDPVVGRFVSPDTKAFNAADVHSFNRYAYADDNPFRYVDPDGKQVAQAIRIVVPLVKPAIRATVIGLVGLGGAIGIGIYNVTHQEAADGKPADGKPADPEKTEAQNALVPGGEPVGEPGTDKDIRVVPGALPEAEELFDAATKGGKVVDKPSYPGTLVAVPGGGTVGLRPNSKSGGPAIDIKGVPGVPFDKVHFRPE